ncbi:hypothetical protein OH799_25890 [Nocardia sp. NBC_00881]|uniref:hypothetical protein n=1 Tax=Nocardia sp. NBC_00881 TaxID=2975995 RepID=UPI003869D3D6|nr:hypothetical protein OH799_25890 [Nocardia sp. NBC_00881]
MAQTLPLLLPDSLVNTHRIDLTALYSKGWGVQAYDVAAAPSGDTFALYGVYRYKWDAKDTGQLALGPRGCGGAPALTATGLGAPPRADPPKPYDGGRLGRRTRRGVRLWSTR